MAGSEPSPAGVLTVIVVGPLTRADVGDLCERARLALEATTAATLTCDVAALVDPDAVVVDALARLALTARRLGRGFRLRHASPALEDLLAWTGLGTVLTACGELRLEPCGQAEEREEPLRVEEEVGPDDAAV
jgi:anti-anti-sigma regulatory factor